MGTDDDGEDAESDAARIPTRVAGAAVEVEQLNRVDPAHMENAQLAVRRKAVVGGAHGMGGTDLHALLAEDRTPQPELAGALKCRRLDIGTSREDDVAIELAEEVGSDLDRIVRMLAEVALGREQSDDVFGHGVDPLVAGLVSPDPSKHRGPPAGRTVRPVPLLAPGGMPHWAHGYPGIPPR